MIDCRKEIALLYVYGWFFIDLLSIIPFDIIFSNIESVNGRSTSMVRLARIGRMYKLVKLTRLLKMLKIIKDRSRLLKYANEALKMGAGFERLFFFLFLFLILSHVVSCLWVLVGNITDEEETWLQGIKDDPTLELYLTSFYFTVETITTVGYGDFGPKTELEKVFCVITMIIGVVSFSFASGSLASIL